VKVPVAPAYLPVPPVIYPFPFGPTFLPPALMPSVPPGTVAVPVHWPLIPCPVEGCVAMQVTSSSPTLAWDESWNGLENAKPVPAGRPLRPGLPIGANVPVLPPGSVSFRVEVLPWVLSERPVSASTAPNAATPSKAVRGLHIDASYCVVCA